MTTEHLLYIFTPCVCLGNCNRLRHEPQAAWGGYQITAMMQAAYATAYYHMSPTLASQQSRLLKSHCSPAHCDGLRHGIESSTVALEPHASTRLQPPHTCMHVHIKSMYCMCIQQLQLWLYSGGLVHVAVCRNGAEGQLPHA